MPAPGSTSSFSSDSIGFFFDIDSTRAIASKKTAVAEYKDFVKVLDLLNNKAIASAQSLTDQLSVSLDAFANNAKTAVGIYKSAMQQMAGRTPGPIATSMPGTMQARVYTPKGFSQGTVGYSPSYVVGGGLKNISPLASAVPSMLAKFPALESAVKRVSGAASNVTRLSNAKDIGVTLPGASSALRDLAAAREDLSRSFPVNESGNVVDSLTKDVKSAIGNIDKLDSKVKNLGKTLTPSGSSYFGRIAKFITSPMGMLTVMSSRGGGVGGGGGGYGGGLSPGQQAMGSMFGFFGGRFRNSLQQQEAAAQSLATTGMTLGEGRSAFAQLFRNSPMGVGADVVAYTLAAMRNSGFRGSRLSGGFAATLAAAAQGGGDPRILAAMASDQMFRGGLTGGQFTSQLSQQLNIARGGGFSLGELQGMTAGAMPSLTVASRANRWGAGQLSNQNVALSSLAGSVARGAGGDDIARDAGRTLSSLVSGAVMGDSNARMRLIQLGANPSAVVRGDVAAITASLKQGAARFSNMDSTTFTNYAQAIGFDPVQLNAMVTGLTSDVNLSGKGPDRIFAQANNVANAGNFVGNFFGRIGTSINENIGGLLSNGLLPSAQTLYLATVLHNRGTGGGGGLFRRAAISSRLWGRSIAGSRLGQSVIGGARGIANSRLGAAAMNLVGRGGSAFSMGMRALPLAMLGLQGADASITGFHDLLSRGSEGGGLQQIGGGLGVAGGVGLLGALGLSAAGIGGGIAGLASTGFGIPLALAGGAIMGATNARSDAQLGAAGTDVIGSGSARDILQAAANGQIVSRTGMFHRGLSWLSGADPNLESATTINRVLGAAAATFSKDRSQGGWGNDSASQMIMAASKGIYADAAAGRISEEQGQDLFNTVIDAVNNNTPETIAEWDKKNVNTSADAQQVKLLHSIDRGISTIVQKMGGNGMTTNGREAMMGG